jgi:hypothetical protein
MKKEKILVKITAALVDIPTAFWDGREPPTSKEDIAAFVQDVTADYKEISGQLADKKAKQSASKEEISGLLDQIMPSSSRPVPPKKEAQKSEQEKMVDRIVSNIM